MSGIARAALIIEGKLNDAPQIQSSHNGIAPWFRSAWFRTSWGLWLGLTMLSGLLTIAPPEYFLGQLLLNVSVFVSLRILAGKRLLNPVQAVVFIFHWWFSVGPTVMSLFQLLLDEAEVAARIQMTGMEGLYIVAFGLPIYAVVANLTLGYLERRRIGLRFLMPIGVNYGIKTLSAMFLIGSLSDVALIYLSQIGMAGRIETNYLGGSLTTVWWVGVIAGLGVVLTFAKSAIMLEMVTSGPRASRMLKILGIGVIVLTLMSAVTSGWKGAFVSLLLYIIVVRVSQTQRVPWKWVVISLVAYLFVIEPFVAAGRYMAEMANVQTSEDRSELFRALAYEGKLTERRSWKDINIGSPFRGIYMFAGEITRRNSLLEGEWKGYTLEWGIRALVPRALSPDKPMMNVGGYFAQMVGVDLGIVAATDYITNVAVSMPFEFVGNFGWIAGVASFALIGFGWALLCGGMLSAEALSSHPLTPWMVGLAFGFEGAVGSFLASIRDLAIPVGAMYVIWRVIGKRL